MSLDCFEEAVQSMIGWPGITALFGGNPCVHPQFPKLCEIITRYIPERQRGLWTNNVFKHGDIAARTFGKGRLNLNAHGDPEAYRNMDRYFPTRVIKGSDRQASWHSAILADYRDLGFTESQWVQMRERCDINQKWSGAIAERDGEPYAYFCEVAASIDGVIGQNHGIRVTPGWWRQRMPAFEHQVRSCCDRGCGVPLRLKGHQDSSDIYDITRSWEFVRQLSPATPLETHEQTPELCRTSTDYMRTHSK